MAESERSSGAAKAHRATNNVNRSPLPGPGPPVPGRARAAGVSGRRGLPRKSMKKTHFGIRVRVCRVGRRRQCLYCISGVALMD